MKRFVRLLSIFLLVTLFCLIFPYRVYAYLDPGSGSYILQLVLAGLLGGFFVIKSYWKKLKYFLLNLFFRQRKGQKR